MRLLTQIAGCLAIASVTASQVAHAQDPIYRGDCTRAEQVKNSIEFDKIFNAQKYRGVTLQRQDDQSKMPCENNLIYIYYLDKSYSSMSEASFSLKRRGIFVGSLPDGCKNIEPGSSAVIGEMKLYALGKKVNDVCEVTMWAEVNMKSSDNPDWKSYFAGNVITLNEGSFIITQGGPRNGKYWTSVSFTKI